MEKNMSSIQPRALTDKELLSAALIVFEPDTGMPLNFQKELICRLASFVAASIEHTADYKAAPNQLTMF
jgi:hypothetical protein